MNRQKILQLGVVACAVIIFLAGCAGVPQAVEVSATTVTEPGAPAKASVAPAAPTSAASTGAQAAAAPAAASTATPSSAPRALDSLGVEVVAVNLSASDFMIDLRYRVKNTERAQALLDRKVRPVLVNEATGDRYYVPNAPKLGALRQTQRTKQVVQLDRVYFMLFANPDRKLRVGEKVTLYAGDSVVHDLVVKH